MSVWAIAVVLPAVLVALIDWRRHGNRQVALFLAAVLGGVFTVNNLLKLIVEGVKKEYQVDSVVIKRKPTSSRPATDQVLDELAKEADLVISAMAD